MARSSGSPEPSAPAAGGGTDSVRRRVVDVPLLILILVGFAAGLASYRDYGVSWDEPLFYAYADAAPYAYSIDDRLAGTFQLERSFGPSADHKRYGPAYLLAARPFVLVWERIAQADRVEAWHLVNALFFLVCVAAVYALSRRWMPRGPALAAAALFATQPLLWGHAFINPKDVPFMTFFTLAVLAGFRMADRLLALPARFTESIEPADASAAPAGALRRRWALILAGLAVAALAAAAFILSSEIEAALRNLVLDAYYSPPADPLRRVFLWLAADANRLPEDFYVDRILASFQDLRAVTLLAAAALLPLSLHELFRRDPAPPRRRAGVSQLLRGVALLPPASSLPTFLLATVVPAVLLGLTIAVRVVGPLAGLLVVLFYLLDRRPRYLVAPLVYLLVACGVAYAAWPFLWGAPLARLAEVARHMADNPAILPVLFGGRVLPSDALPDSYLPTLLATTLTEPVWLLFLGGLIAARRRADQGSFDGRSFLLTMLWFALPTAYVMLARPPMYDGFRHFLFILPPVFAAAGLSFQWLGERLRSSWGRGVIVALLLLPGVVAILRLHPYPYAYFNAFVGGSAGAFRRYENDYWLTCYKEMMARVRDDPSISGTVFPLAQPEIAAAYAPPKLTVEKFEEGDDRTFPGSFLLLPTRANFDQAYHPEDPVVVAVGRLGATYCVLKEVAGGG